MSSSVATNARITPAIGRITLSVSVSDHAEYAAVPHLRRCAHVVRDARHLPIHIVKQPCEVAHNAADEQFLQPLRNLMPKKIQNNHLLSYQISQMPRHSSSVEKPGQQRNQRRADQGDACAGNELFCALRLC